MSATLSPAERESILAVLRAGTQINTTIIDGNHIAYAGKTDRQSNRLFATGSEKSFLRLLAQSRALEKTLKSTKN